MLKNSEGIFNCGCLYSAEENGLVAPSVRRGPSPEVTAAPTTETPSKPSAVNEDSAAPTPTRPAGKSKQQLNIRAELEKRQGGKPLLNLVVIGMIFSLTIPSCHIIILLIYWCCIWISFILFINPINIKPLLKYLDA